MLRIRFQRVGRKNDPAFRVVVTEKRSKPQGAGHEALGSYHPKTKQAVLKNDRILHWLSQGARASDAAHNLFVARGVFKGKKRGVAPRMQQSAEEKTEKKEKQDALEASGEKSAAESLEKIL